MEFKVEQTQRSGAEDTEETVLPRGCWGALRPVLSTMKLESEAGGQTRTFSRLDPCSLAKVNRPGGQRWTVYFCACRGSTNAHQTNRSQIGVYIPETHISPCVCNAVQVNKNTGSACRITFNPQNRLLHFANKC